ncbi:hypothetical protein C9374_004277 [Naegleria lovaniensis]|uniref:Uncharacterized protein n=1 Tax=Naegleria lovaniensis TaxID=51637 RepID=A0AA88GQR8_NAELO|nr:uncharacterized protein C9374_004277 [Naegleria lovaniensis]KAG2383606.1 hypothetical protein C9374_004277 [Naegleria lovaniensis]
MQNTLIRKTVKMTNELIKERDVEMEIIRKIKSMKRRKGSREAKEKLKNVEDHSKFFISQNNMLAKQMIAKHALKAKQHQLEENYLNVYEKRMKEVQSKAQNDALNLYELDEKRHINRKRKEIALYQLDMVKQAQVDKLQSKMLKAKVDKYLSELEKEKREEEDRKERELRNMHRKRQKEIAKLEKEKQRPRDFKFIKELSSQQTREIDQDEDHYSDSSYITDSDDEDAPIVVVTKSQKPAVGNINIDLSKINAQRPYTESEKYDTARSSLSARLSVGNFSPRINLDQQQNSSFQSPRDFDTYSSSKKEQSNHFNTIGISSQFL